jgi:protein phosphatase
MERATQAVSYTNLGAPAGGELVVNAFGQTDPGLVRSANQDHFLIASLLRQAEVMQTSLGEDQCTGLDCLFQGWALMVADGMGGHAGGEEASAMVVESSLHYLRSTVPWFLNLGPDHAEVAEETLRSMVRRCHDMVLAASLEEPVAKRKMGTTLTLAYVLWPRLFVVHAGDSRCYLIRGGRMRQVTRDHTMAQELVDHAGMDPEKAGETRHANMLTNVVGGGAQQEVEPDVSQLELQDRDTLLLCTDGLTKMVSDREIRRLIRTDTFAKARCQALIEAANKAGGKDNVTVVLASFSHQRE